MAKKTVASLHEGSKEGTSMCRCRPGSTHVRGRLDFFPYD